MVFLHVLWIFLVNAFLRDAFKKIVDYTFDRLRRTAHKAQVFTPLYSALCTKNTFLISQVGRQQELINILETPSMYLLLSNLKVASLKYLVPIHRISG